MTLGLIFSISVEMIGLFVDIEETKQKL